MNRPLLICVCALAILWAVARLGAFLGKKWKTEDESENQEFWVILGANLTLLGLLVGFSFSMAIGRFDQRKSDEEEEANAIGTEYLRLDLLAEPVRLRIQGELAQYLQLRIQKYDTDASDNTLELDAKTAQLQGVMWNEVRNAASEKRDPLTTTVVTGMNDVINRQGYTQAARWNRIPHPAWGMMAAIALISNFLIRFGQKKIRRVMSFAFPLSIAISLYLIADIDSPRGGLIRVVPQNLIALADSLHSRPQ